MIGLTEKEATINRQKYGTNDIKLKNKNTFLNLFIESLGDPIIRILLIALAIKTIFLIKDFDWYETIGIVISIIIASLISTLSEYGASISFNKLMEETSRIKCKVKREGKLKEIPIEEIVVGDIMYLTSGDFIGADGSIISGEVEVDESSMTGETKSVKKQKNETVYRGCVVYNGSGYVRVDKVGSNTYYGRMMTELDTKNSTSPLKERLNHLALIISKIGYFCAFLVSVSYLFNKIVISNDFVIDKILLTLSDFSLVFAYLLHALTLSVTIIVVSVPEGLPMMITLILATNMNKMLKNNVLVRKLVGIETSGSLNILFTDKTGTLTKGKLEVVRFLLGNLNEYSSISEVSPKFQNTFINSLIYNNDSSYDKDINQIIGGNITDKAIMEYIKINKSPNVQIVDKIFFDSKNKYSLTITLDNNKYYKYVKGAPEVILDKCTRYLNEDGFKQLILDKNKLNNKLKSITSKGVRVLCVAYNEENNTNLNNLILLGFLLIKDEVRKESIEAIQSITAAGIQTVMLTGDNINTAISIAKEVGIIKKDDDIICTHQDLNNLSDEGIKKILPQLRVVARAMPEDKSRLVKLAKECNMVVGMTGDGVNDAIALKNADVGFAVGSGTEVAKESADIIILDDNILSIEKAISYGRTIFKSIRKFIVYQLTVNLCAITISVIGPFIGIGTPVTVIQMLWINMVMDTLAGLAFSYEPVLKEYMEELPKKRNEAIINKYMLNEILVTGFYSSFLCLFFLKSPLIANLFRKSPNNIYLLTAFFGLFIFISIFNSFNARTTRLNIFSNIFKNKVFLLIMSFVSLVQILMIYYGKDIFRTSGLTINEFIIMIMISITVIPVDIIRKIYLKVINKDLTI